MHELDLALAAHDASGERTRLMPIVNRVDGLASAWNLKDLLEDDWRVLKQDDSLGPKVDVDRWGRNFEKLKKLARHILREGESEEDFLERCSESIVQAMERGPFECDYDVFIAHAGVQKDSAVQLRSTLKELGLRAFVDKRDLPQGSGDADARMTDALKRAHVGVAVLSRAFLQKTAPMRELHTILEHENLMPILYDVTYEQMEELCQGDTLLGEKEFKRKVLRVIAHLNVEDQDFSTVLCQRVAFAVVRQVASKCSIDEVTSQAAFTFVERVHAILDKVVNEPDCLPDISKSDVTQAKIMLRNIRAVLEHSVLSKTFSLRGVGKLCARL